MHVGVLGPLEVATDGRVVEIGGARLRALLARLALDAGRVVTVDSLASALWADDGPSDPTNALQSQVARLRRLLPQKAVVRSASGGYALDLPPEAVDAVRFELLAREGRRTLRGGQVGVAALRLREGLALWRGEALADVAEAPFARAARVRLEELRITATEDRLEAELEAGADASRLVVELEAITAEHPLRERLRGLLLRALLVDGRRTEALAAYETFRRLVAEELGADPGPDLQALHLAMLRGEGLRERRPVAEGPSNLPVPLTSFVGRGEELRLARAQLEEGRLVTLVGPGGSGKTRLGVTLAAELLGRFPGGIWLVDLAPAYGPDDVTRALVGVLGLREAGPLEARSVPRDAVDRLVEALSATESLIVLDNCEHVVEAAARLADILLGRCPGLRVLATSREPLGLVGEALCQVQPLPLPAPGAGPAEALRSPAVRLFAERVVAVRPGFAVTDHNVAAIASVCRRLDGLPLAIELAAARLRSLPLERLEARLDDRFRLLAAGSPSAPPRHQTLRAVVGWSWDLLEDEERRFAERLSVFQGTITPDAAGRVYAAASWDSATVQDALSSLVDKSLLQAVDAPEPRYRMLETIREYGLEQLARGGEIADARVAHAAYFLDLAERAEPWLREGSQVAWIRLLVAEHDNLLAALRFVIGSGHTDIAVRLVAALGMFWTVLANHGEGAHWLRLALEMPADAPEEATVAATVFYLLNTIMSGGAVAADPALERITARARRAARAAAHPGAALLEPTLALAADDPPRGVAAIDRRLSHPHPWTRAMLRLLRALFDVNSGDMEGMALDLAAAVESFRAVGERWGLATSLAYLAYTRSTLGDFRGAIAALEDADIITRALSTAALTLARLRMIDGFLSSRSTSWSVIAATLAMLKLWNASRKARHPRSAGRAPQGLGPLLPPGGRGAPEERPRVGERGGWRGRERAGGPRLRPRSRIWLGSSARRIAMSLDVSPELIAQAERGEVEDEAFVETVRRSLPYAWTVMSRVAGRLEEAWAAGDALADDATPPPTEEDRGQLLRALASNSIRGALERHFGVAFAFQNCHRVAAFRPQDVGGDAYRDFVSVRSQVLNQTPALRHC
jgi:predicted ATPase/DNA-binding SARP family transcriptional activator